MKKFSVDVVCCCCLLEDAKSRKSKNLSSFPEAEKDIDLHTGLASK